MCRLSHWSGQQQHLLQRLQVLGAQEMQWAQALDKGPWIQMYMVPGNCTPLAWQTTEGSPSRTWQAGGGSFLLLPKETCSQQLLTVNFQPQHVWKPPGRSSRSCYQFSLPATSLPRHVGACTALVCGVQCSMPTRLGHWQSQTYNVCGKMTRQWTNRSAMSNRKTLSPPDPMSCMRGLHWGSGPHSAPLVQTCGTLQWCSQDSLWPTGWWKAWAWETKDDMEAADREGLQRMEALRHWPSW